ncbi:MAG: hypothetical protein HFI80_10865 [Lachnospiraceae bacterium]|nr:hypothetical protein [Lachnospiraceae bacterium]MCI9662017.1 hypothetical protein [Lachnospiraceae bacterium]
MRLEGIDRKFVLLQEELCKLEDGDSGLILASAMLSKTLGMPRGAGGIQTTPTWCSGITGRNSSALRKYSSSFGSCRKRPMKSAASGTASLRSPNRITGYCTGFMWKKSCMQRWRKGAGTGTTGSKRGGRKGLP